MCRRLIYVMTGIQGHALLCTFVALSTLLILQPTSAQNFYADFEDGIGVNDPAQWVPDNPGQAWGIADFPGSGKGLKNLNEGCGTSGNTPLPGVTDFKDGIIQLDMSWDDDDSWGVVFRKTDDDAGYIVFFGYNETPSVIIGDIANGCAPTGSCLSDTTCEGGGGELIQVPHGLGSGLTQDLTVSYTGRVEVRGHTIKVWYLPTADIADPLGDLGAPLVEIQDGAHAGPGSVGVWQESQGGSMIDNVMVIVGDPGAAGGPSPADEAVDVPRDVVLSWKPGIHAAPTNGHKVYFGENFDDVNNAVGGVAQTATSYDPGRLSFETTYYWRVDEVNAPPTSYVEFKGNVWSFTTEPVGYPIENVTATASSSSPDKGSENTVNGSGLDDSGLLHTNAGDLTMWLSDATGPQPTWIEYEFDKIYKLHEMWVWNSNEAMEPVIGFGFKDVTIEYSTNGTEYTTLGTTHEFARAPGTPDYAHNTTVDLGGVGAKYVRLTANKNWGGIMPQFGLSEVRFFYIPVLAREPAPASGAIDVDVEAVLSWRAGREAAEHDVHISTDEQAVIDGTAYVTTVTETSYGPLSLDLAQTYYWKINEVNEAEIPTTWKGDVWSFTTMPADALERPSVVSTFHCIGIYWSPAEGSSNNPCEVRYRKDGTAEWKAGMNLWFDERNSEYRGSIVHLEPATTYEVELTLPLHRSKPTVTFTAATWDERFPVAETIELPGYSSTTLEINNSGTPDGYILYTASAGDAVIDVTHNRDYCITVNASYIIIRGLNLKGAKRYGIRLYDCHDVVIERCDISDFSSIEGDGWGNRGAAIFSNTTTLERIIVQRNKMHHPYSDTNNWSEYRAKYGQYKPRGPKTIGYVNSAGNHVVRYNEIYSDNDHYFEDCISSGGNNFPNRDSDIYGNYIANCWDDGIEAENDNCNVRIWGNFIEWTFVKIAIAPTTVGPVYIWRNVAGVGRGDNIQPWNDVSRGGFLKTSDIDGGGKIYVFHNTILQPEPPVGVDYALGCNIGLGWGGPMLNTMSRNNILHICNPSGPSIWDRNHNPLGDYNYDLFNGNINAYPGAERHGIKGVPIYDPNNGDGEFALDSSSPGYDAGVVIPNFNDNYNGAAPDIGAHEAGSPPMEFGVDAYQ